MLFQSSFHLLVYASVLLVLIHSQRSNGNAANYAPKCQLQNTAKDQVVDYPVVNRTAPERIKRFVLFPEFVLFLDDWRYINAPKDLLYWVSNFYPDRINNSYIHDYIKEIIRQIDAVVDIDLTIQLATDPGEANFNFYFFDYTKCPTNDATATVDGVLAHDQMLIYPVELTRKSRYRANGGIEIREQDRRVSMIKLNMQQTFLLADDYIYDPVIYTCDDDKNECVVDLFWVLLHETLHGFGIEHTTNAQKPIPPNPQIQSVMHFSNFRFLCHDDVRALRMIYNHTVTRENNIHDDTCRRDFPMSFLQKLMYLIGRYIIFGLLIFVVLSFAIFILTMIYILIRRLIPTGKELSRVKTEKPILRAKGNNKPHGYLWHDDMI